MLGSLFQRPSNAIQATPWGDWPGDQQATSSGQSVSVDTAWQLLTVYGCTRFIADGVSTLPPQVFRDSPDGPVKLQTPGWILQPTPDMDFVAWCGQVLTSMLLAGDAFAFYVYEGVRLAGLLPIDPTKVQVRRERNRKVFVIDGKTYSTFEVLHIPALMMPGRDRGYAPVDAARELIGAGMSMEQFAGRFFDQGATLSGVIEVPGELAPEKAREMARLWSRRHGGKAKAHLPGVLQGGATWKPMGITNEQAQFLESRKFTASQIASQMFLIDPTEMGLPIEGSSLTYGNLEQRNARKVQVTYLPWIVRIEKALTALLPKPHYLKLNVNGLLRGDTKTRYETYEIGTRAGILLPDEARALEELPALPDGETPPQEGDDGP